MVQCRDAALAGTLYSILEYAGFVLPAAVVSGYNHHGLVIERMALELGEKSLYCHQSGNGMPFKTLPSGWKIFMFELLIEVKRGVGHLEVKVLERWLFAVHAHLLGTLVSESLYAMRILWLGCRGLLGLGRGCFEDGEKLCETSAIVIEPEWFDELRTDAEKGQIQKETCLLGDSGNIWCLLFSLWVYVGGIFRRIANNSGNKGVKLYRPALLYQLGRDRFFKGLAEKILNRLLVFIPLAGQESGYGSIRL